MKDLTNSTVARQNILNNEELLGQFEQMCQMILESLSQGGTLFVAGNGGSAADAQHLVAELVVKLNKDRDPIRSVALTVDSSILTAAGNDYSYAEIFSRQIEALARPQDVFLGITTSGNSPNILKAFEMCKKRGVKTICLTGKDGGVSKKENKADLHVIATGSNTARIQEAHENMYHTLCYVLETEMIKKGLISYRS